MSTDTAPPLVPTIGALDGVVPRVTEALDLRAEGLVKVYGGNRVVDGVSLHVGAGEVVGLLGPNGAGKTTTFQMIVGFAHADGGTIHLGETAITRLAMHRRARLGIGYLAQEPSVFRQMSVRDNVRAILETQPGTARERRERCDALLESLDLTQLARRQAYALSGGERRRVEIARALVTRPRFLLLDEPFVGIDPIAVSELQDIVGRLRDLGIGILITDHNVRETLSTTDRAYILYRGRIVVSGTAAQLADDPAARRVYLGERFRL